MAKRFSRRFIDGFLTAREAILTPRLTAPLRRWCTQRANAIERSNNLRVGDVKMLHHGSDAYWLSRQQDMLPSNRVNGLVNATSVTDRSEGQRLIARTVRAGARWRNHRRRICRRRSETRRDFLGASYERAVKTNACR